MVQFVSLLESNGGRNDIKVISMWAMTAQYWSGAQYSLSILIAVH